MLDTSEEDPFAGSDSNEDPDYSKEHSTSDSSESEDSDPAQKKAERNAQSAVKLQNDKELANQPKQLARKRKRLPETWKRNKQRQLRLAGKEHLSQKGNTVRAKAVKVVLCKCHYKCNDKFNMQEREQIFQDYLSLKDERSRWSFISKCVSKNIPKRRYAMVDHTNSTSRRQQTLVYTLTSTRGTHQVCKAFFWALWIFLERKSKL